MQHIFVDFYMSINLPFKKKIYVLMMITILFVFLNIYDPICATENWFVCRQRKILIIYVFMITILFVFSPVIILGII